jgi:diaminopimelate decarboxylase
MNHPNLAQALVHKYFGASNHQLHISGIPVKTIADQVGTPLFIYDRGIMDSKLAGLRGCLPERFEVYYSVKANPNQDILRAFVEQGCGLEIASGGEFRQALKAGAVPERILYAGPGKTEYELDRVIAAGIGEIHVESALEYERINRICTGRGLRARLAVRVNPGADALGGAMRMGGKSSQFGIDEECAQPLIHQIASDPVVDFRGIHVFSGTQILDYEILLAQYKKAFEISIKVSSSLGRSLPTIDLGGGLGIPYFAHEKELDLDALKSGLRALMMEMGKESSWSETRFVLEPGRFLVGDAGIYVTRINDIKTSRGKTFLITDGGMNHHLAASGNLGQTIKRNYPVAVLNRLTSPLEMHADIVGPLCTPLDTIAREVELPSAQVGDLIGIFQSGAYARTASPLGFLGHPSPPEVMIEGGACRLIRGRGTCFE